MTSSLPTWTRADSVSRLDGDFDVLVVGGGITGSGAALDLAGRGLSVALVEQADFAQGTSSRSTKLFHGGIRYLPQFHFNLVSEGLREQKVLARIADFLYEPLEFVLPLYEQYAFADAPAWAAKGWKAPLALRAGLTLYDVLGGVGRPGDHHRRIDADELRRLMPSVRPEGLKGGFVYSDAQTDDARLVVTVLKTAVRRYGAVAAGRMRVDTIEPLSTGFRAGVTDLESGEQVTVKARAVLAATGAFTPPGLTTGAPTIKLVMSKGTHLLVGADRLGLDGRALVLPETDDGRVLFIVPWLGHSMIGTTDTEYTDDPTHPVARDEDVDYLIRHVERYLEVDDLEPISAFAGLRALADTGAGSTAKASREHMISEPIPGYVQVAGGKLTTYRRIAAEASDRVTKALGSDARSRTAETPLVGAGGDPGPLRVRLKSVGVPESAINPTISRFGTEVEGIARFVEADPFLATALGDGRSTLADVVYAVRHEAATNLTDVTLRRTHLAWFTTDHARRDAPRLAAVMASELGWDAARVERELAEHEQELVAEGL
ncbi:MAG: FAD-dependent oxidoreductase [Acidimicrobiia bacterium]